MYIGFHGVYFIIFRNRNKWNLIANLMYVRFYCMLNYRLHVQRTPFKAFWKLVEYVKRAIPHMLAVWNFQLCRISTCGLKVHDSNHQVVWNCSSLHHGHLETWSLISCPNWTFYCILLHYVFRLDQVMTDNFCFCFTPIEYESLEIVFLIYNNPIRYR